MTGRSRYRRYRYQPLPAATTVTVTVTSPLAAFVLPLPAVTSHRQGPSRRYCYRHRYHGWPADASRRTRHRYQPLPAAVAAVCYRYLRYPDPAGHSFNPSTVGSPIKTCPQP
jgi:hypothetical protein